MSVLKWEKLCVRETVPCGKNEMSDFVRFRLAVSGLVRLTRQVGTLVRLRYGVEVVFRRAQC